MSKFYCNSRHFNLLNNNATKYIVASLNKAGMIQKDKIYYVFWNDLMKYSHRGIARNIIRISSVYLFRIPETKTYCYSWGKHLSAICFVSIIGHDRRADVRLIKVMEVNGEYVSNGNSDLLFEV